MSYKNDSEIVILNRLSKADDAAKAELFETYDQLRDLTVSGPSIGGSGLGPVGSFFIKFAQMFSGSAFLPSIGNQSINIPGTSYFSPIRPGTGIIPGGQSSFGLGPLAQVSGFPNAGSAAPFDPTSILSSVGIGNAALPFGGIGDPNFPLGEAAIGGTIAGGAAPLGYTIAGGASSLGPGGTAAGVGVGLVGASGFGRGLVLPAAGIASGIGGLLTSLAPLFGGSGAGLAGLAAGTILSGFSGAVLQSYQHVSNRVLVNADTILSSKVRNLETISKQLGAQKDVIKKLLKESVDGDRKALQDL